MLIILYDDFKKDVRVVEQSIYRFLEVDDTFKAVKPRDRMVANYLNNHELLIKLSERSSTFNYFWTKSRHFRQVFLSRSSKRNQMSDLDRNYLLKVYDESNRRLEEYLGVDLSAWR